MFKHFAKKWGLAEPTVNTIFLIVQNNGGKYGKTSRALEDMGLKLSVRQIKYFYRRVRLEERLDIQGKGKPKNYRAMLQSFA